MRKHSFLTGSLPRKEYPGFDQTHSDRQMDTAKLNWPIIYALNAGLIK
jgi:hypothetical protein